MKLLIDHADIDEIKRLYDLYPIDGVSTNPTILSRTGKNPWTVLEEIREFIGPDADLHVQAISKKADQMIKEAEIITNRLGKNTLVKIPAIPEGIKAIKKLAEKGCRITATAIYTPMQAYLAGKAGAEYVAPYVNRIDNLGGDGVAITKKIQELFDQNEMQTKILAASFKNSRQVQDLVQAGIAASTCAPQVIDGFLANPSVNSAVDQFIGDFERLCGEGKTMLDC